MRQTKIETKCNITVICWLMNEKKEQDEVIACIWCSGTTSNSSRICTSTANICVVYILYTFHTVIKSFYSLICIMLLIITATFFLLYRCSEPSGTEDKDLCYNQQSAVTGVTLQRISASGSRGRRQGCEILVPITVDGNVVNSADNFVNLGSLASSDGYCPPDINRVTHWPGILSHLLLAQHM